MAQPYILSLPSELKCHIAELLAVDYPDTLAALARTHTSYQREAEKALYDTIYIYTSEEDSVQCMEALARYPEKAGLVRFLTVEYVEDNTHKNRKVTGYLSRSLTHMHALSDFRLRSCPGGVEAQSIMKLGKIICQDPSHFRLRTLYCHDLLNISRIIKIQTGLHLLGLYHYEMHRLEYILKTLIELHDAQSYIPMIVSMERKDSSLIPSHIYIFPAFYSFDRCVTIPQVLAQTFSKDHDDAAAEDVFELSIYMTDSSDLPSIRAIAKEMAVTFPQICWLNLMFKTRCDISPVELKKEFSFFTILLEVNTYVWPMEL